MWNDAVGSKISRISQFLCLLRENCLRLIVELLIVSISSVSLSRISSFSVDF